MTAELVRDLGDVEALGLDRLRTRVVATSFVHHAAVVARTHVHSPTAVVAKFGEHTMLATVLGASVAAVRRELHAALRASGHVPSDSGQFPPTVVSCN